MNRPIEFRGKRIDNGKWVYGYYRCIKWELDRETHEIINGNSFFKVILESVGQYTDKEDKNGVKAFENDLVSHGDFVGRVEFFKGMFCVRTKVGIWGLGNSFEIIGNALEHSHLLEGRKE